MNEDIRRLEEKILQRANPDQAEYLRTQRAFCSPSAFWNGALSFGLCSKQDYDYVQKMYGVLFSYAGD